MKVGSRTDDDLVLWKARLADLVLEFAEDTIPPDEVATGLGSETGFGHGSEARG